MGVVVGVSAAVAVNDATIFDCAISGINDVGMWVIYWVSWASSRAARA